MSVNEHFRQGEEDRQNEWKISIPAQDEEGTCNVCEASISDQGENHLRH